MSEKLKTINPRGVQTLVGIIDGIIEGIKQTADESSSAVSSLGEDLNGFAALTAAALEEIAGEMKKLNPAFVTGALAAGGWVDNTDAGSKAAGYGKMYTLAVSDAAAADRAECQIMPAGERAAAACGLCPACDVADGSIRFYAVAAPGAEIALQYRLIKA